MGRNRSDIRDTADTLTISPNTIMHELQKGVALTSVNQSLLSTVHPRMWKSALAGLMTPKWMKCGAVGGKK
jgi:hypothetical protein